MARQICTIVENNSMEDKHLNELKSNFKTYGYAAKIVEIKIQKALKIQQIILWQSETINPNFNLTFMSTFNANNPKTIYLIKTRVNILVQNKVIVYRDIRLIYAKYKPTNLEKNSISLCIQVRHLTCSNAQKVDVNAAKILYGKIFISSKLPRSNSS